ncbi:MAG TPA: tol-pal system-associated acyl-CoA thioesterase [Patescibacteria group bacterium]|nr:tol-pal system-associated acyl-CoA thioesterase [Patescibacteria group bacterium]
MNTAFTWPVRVYYEDTDAGGVVYHARYLHFLERARTEWLRSIGVDQSRLKRDRGLVFVVSRVSLSFRRPAKLDDTLLASCVLIERRGASLRFTQELRMAGSGELLLDADVLAACVNADTFRPAALPRDLFPE